jgi:hypothetical protein
MPSQTLPATKRSTLLGATLFAGALLANPLAAQAQTAATQTAAPQSTAPQSTAGAAATETKGETVEQRIATLHTALQITPAQDAKWQAVAQAMRENATAMDKLIAQTNLAARQSMTAVQDLDTYRKFAQAHVDGLKNLIDDFSALYAVMPDPQKKIADQVFKSTGA